MNESIVQSLIPDLTAIFTALAALVGAVGGVIAATKANAAKKESSAAKKASESPTEHSVRHGAAIQSISDMLVQHMDDDAVWRKRIENKVDAHALYSLIETDCHEFLKRRSEKRFLSKQEARAFAEYVRQYKELSGNDMNGLEHSVLQVLAMPVRG